MANNIETYCMVQIRKRYRSEFDIDKVNIKDFSDRTPYGTISYYIWIDYGDRKGWNWLKMKNGKFYKFDSFVEAINFMAKQGWKLIKNIMKCVIFCLVRKFQHNIIVYKNFLSANNH